MVRVDVDAVLDHPGVHGPVETGETAAQPSTRPVTASDPMKPVT